MFIIRDKKYIDTWLLFIPIARGWENSDVVICRFSVVVAMGEVVDIFILSRHSYNYL